MTGIAVFDAAFVATAVSAAFRTLQPLSTLVMPAPTSTILTANARLEMHIKQCPKMKH
jgi:hypothetical protein